VTLRIRRRRPGPEDTTAVADLEALETWLSPLLQKLGGSQQRIRAQVNPDGSPYVQRKPRDLRGKKGRIKRRMFEKIGMARYLKAKGTPQEVVVDFAGRVSRIARVHQYGLKDRAERGAPQVRYAQRKLLGVSEKDLQLVRELILDGMDLQQCMAIANTNIPPIFNETRPNYLSELTNRSLQP